MDADRTVCQSDLRTASSSRVFTWHDALRGGRRSASAIKINSMCSPAIDGRILPLTQYRGTRLPSHSFVFGFW